MPAKSGQGRCRHLAFNQFRESSLSTKQPAGKTMDVNINNIDIKRAQRKELLLDEAFKRASVVKAYEAVKADKVQLPAPTQLDWHVRPRKVRNICDQLRGRIIHGSVVQEDIVSNIDLETRVRANLDRLDDPLPILPKAMNVWCNEQTNLQNLTLETRLNKNSWIVAIKKLETIEEELHEMKKDETQTPPS